MQHRLQLLEALAQAQLLHQGEIPPTANRHRQIATHGVEPTPEAHARSITQQLLQAVAVLEQISNGSVSGGDQGLESLCSHWTLPRPCRSGCVKPRLCSHSRFQSRER